MAVSTLVDVGGVPIGWILGSLALLLVSVALLLWQKVSHNGNLSQRWGAVRQPSVKGTSLDDEEPLAKAQPLTILYGTQTGTAEGFAKVMLAIWRSQVQDRIGFARSRTAAHLCVGGCGNVSTVGGQLALKPDTRVI